MENANAPELLKVVLRQTFFEIQAITASFQSAQGLNISLTVLVAITITCLEPWKTRVLKFHLQVRKDCVKFLMSFCLTVWGNIQARFGLNGSGASTHGRVTPFFLVTSFFFLFCFFLFGVFLGKQNPETPTDCPPPKKHLPVSTHCPPKNTGLVGLGKRVQFW